MVAGQPADQAGMRADDVLLAIDGVALEGPRDLQRIVASTQVGKVIKVSLMREGKDAEVAVTVGAYQGPRAQRRPSR